MFAISIFVDHLFIDKLLHGIRMRTDLDNPGNDKALMFSAWDVHGFFFLHFMIEASLDQSHL